MAINWRSPEIQEYNFTQNRGEFSDYRDFKFEQHMQILNKLRVIFYQVDYKIRLQNISKSFWY